MRFRLGLSAAPGVVFTALLSSAAGQSPQLVIQPLGEPITAAASGFPAVQAAGYHSSSSAEPPTAADPTATAVILTAQNAQTPANQATPTTPTIPGPEPAFLESPPTNTAQPTPSRPAPAKPKGPTLAERVAGAYKDPFYLNDFSYLNDPKYDDWHLGENFKRIPVGEGFLDLGGSYRLRYHNEHNFRGLGLTGRDDEFLLDQTRLFSNWKVNDTLRIYSEFIDSGSSWEDFAPRPIEVNQFDLQNLFADVVLIDGDVGKVTARGGRQELLFGSQRLVSPLIWSNTRRTFDGGRLTWDTGNDYVVDAFWTRPVRVFASDYDSPNQNQQFFGTYIANASLENSQLDSYYLGLLDDFIDERVHTLGQRVSGGVDSYLWDLEYAYQFGEYRNGNDISAAFTTAGLGYKFAGDWKPVVWSYYDWASGGDGVNTGFNQLFPLGHKYLGFMDLYGRRNIQDANMTFAVSPTKKFSTLLWYHYFFLNSNGDGPYTVVNTPFNPGGTVGSRDLGHELDVLGTYRITPHSELLLGYSHYFTGRYYETSRRADGTPLFQGDADFYYVQWLQNF